MLCTYRKMLPKDLVGLCKTCLRQTQAVRCLPGLMSCIVHKPQKAMHCREYDNLWHKSGHRCGAASRSRGKSWSCLERHSGHS